MRFRSILCVCAIVLGFSAVASAQDLCPAGTPQTPSFTVNAGVVTVTACHDEKDAQGQSSPILAWRTDVDGTKTSITMTKNPTPSPTSGEFLFTGTFTVAKGNHQFRLENDQTDGVGGVITSVAGPFALAAKGTGKPPRLVIVK